MVAKNILVALALASAASAAPALIPRGDECQAAYQACVAAGTPEVACSCTLAVCLGQDNARGREYCASATASLFKTTLTTTVSPSATQTWTSISGIPGGCNPAHPGSCPDSYFTTKTVQTTVKETFTPIPGIPGGCNPAHPGSCPSSYFTYKTVTPTTTPCPSVSTSAPAPPPAKPTQDSGSKPDGSGYRDPVPVEGKTWAIKDMTRYCGEDKTGCDYNFVIQAGDKTERCTVIRQPGANAATESWSDQPCTAGSEFKVSWGYVLEPAPAFAVVTVVKGKELAWFGVSNVNGQAVTPSNPFGSGQYGDLPASQVYTY